MLKKVDIDSVYIATYGDSSLTNSAEISSQMGGIVLLRDKHNNAVPVYWFSRKCPRVLASILAVETITCVTGFDAAFAIRNAFEKTLARQLPLYLYTNSYSLFITVNKCQSVREKRLLTDLSIIRQAYQRGKITNMGFVRTEHVIADPLTNITSNALIGTLLRTRKLTHPVEEFIVADEITPVGDCTLLPFTRVPIIVNQHCALPTKRKYIVCQN